MNKYDWLTQQDPFKIREDDISLNSYSYSMQPSLPPIHTNYTPPFFAVISIILLVTMIIATATGVFKGEIEWLCAGSIINITFSTLLKKTERKISLLITTLITITAATILFAAGLITHDPLFFLVSSLSLLPLSLQLLHPHIIAGLSRRPNVPFELGSTIKYAQE